MKYATNIEWEDDESGDVSSDILVPDGIESFHDFVDFALEKYGRRIKAASIFDE